MEKTAMGIIVANRGFFVDELCEKARSRLLPGLEEYNIKPVILDENERAFGSVQNRDDAKKCANLFQKHRKEIKGIIISLPNFGDEKAIADTIKLSGLEVPVLVQAFPDELKKLDYSNRRDSFCGKISVCNNLQQYGINYSLTETHTMDPESELFKKDLRNFIGICKTVAKIRDARIGLIGARPADFNTVRYSEKILEKNKITVEPVGLLDFINKINNFSDHDSEVKNSLEELNSYMNTEKVPAASMVKMAKLLTVYRSWIEEKEIDAVAFRCWDSLQDSLGINPCLVMSLLSNEGIPSACESDVMGALSMYVLQLASGLPSGIVDWNNNFNKQSDKTVIFHCGNFARDIYSCSGDNCPAVNYPEILASSLGQENTYGSIDGRIKPGELTFARLSTDDNTGEIKAYLAEGEITEETLDTFGSWGVAKVEDLQDFLKYICQKGCEHHVEINLSSVADILEEAFDNYLGWEVYNHNDKNL